MLATLLFTVLQVSATTAAESERLVHASGDSVRIVTAVRTAEPPAVDGQLAEAAWSSAPAISGFVQENPEQGEPATQRTEVRILYDDEAIYIGARLFEMDPSDIRATLTRRDQSSASDRFTVALDSYHDHQTTMSFSVNPLGVRGDAIGSDDQHAFDDSWDPVWEAATGRDAEGWIAEMRIPLSQLRFPQKAAQVWGINLYRLSVVRQEQDVFALVRQNEIGVASRYAHVVGITGIPSPRRLEVAPYASASFETANALPGNPFFDGSELSVGYGIDLKYGVTSNLTLDATINPDFGQVEADPAELNLTVFETFFQERRPFFVEGSQIFDFGGSCSNICLGLQPIFFYSRRIGRAPSLGPTMAPVSAAAFDTLISGPFTDVPANTRILGAAKLTGKLSSGTSIGFLHAETDHAFGRVYAAGRVAGNPRLLRYRDELEPRGHHSVGRIIQDFRGGATSLGALVTHVARELDSPRLADRMPERSLAGGLDWRHRWNDNRFTLAGQVGWSRIEGSAAAIERAQLSSARYYRRPDANYVELDTTRTSLSGYNVSTDLAYNAKSGFNFGFSGSVVSPGFELNDLGFLPAADERSGLLRAGWSRPEPGDVIQYQEFDTFVAGSWNTGGTHLGTTVGLGSFIGLQNNWRGSMFLMYAPRGLDDNLTRGGPLAVRPSYRSGNFNFGSDRSRAVSFSVFGNLRRTEFGGGFSTGSVDVLWRPATNVQLSVGPSYSVSRSEAFYTATIDDAEAAATFGRRYVFAESEQRSLGLTTRMSYTFTPALSFQLYMQPFTASAEFSGFKELRRPREFDFLVYGRDDGSTIQQNTQAPGCARAGACHTVDPDGGTSENAFVIADPDVSFRSLRGTAVLRWEYRPGATFFAVWTQSRSDNDHTGQFGGAGDIPDLFALPGENIFLLKATYWFSR
ncbi:MAG: DUF5916 domain-containing protein [Gemmatimonadaceae bacterium]